MSLAMNSNKSECLTINIAKKFNFVFMLY